MTVKVYAVPLAKPNTVIGAAAGPATVPVKPPGDDVAVYPVIALPPSDTGAVKVTMACAFPPVAVPIVGASGAAAGITGFEGPDAAPVPMALIAATAKV